MAGTVAAQASKSVQRRVRTDHTDSDVEDEDEADDTLPAVLAKRLEMVVVVADTLNAVGTAVEFDGVWWEADAGGG